jgi:sugar O-acyltransferase (sialic acid O-acetyltransferase NeuD family)
MLIVGAGGLATQLIEDFIELKKKDIVFWSEVKTKYPFIEEMFPILSTDAEASHYFATVSTEFILSVGNDKSDGRRRLSERFKRMGGEIVSYLSPFSRISPYGTHFGKGTIILNQVNVEPGVIIGEECIVNKTGNIGHGCIIGSYSEIGPGVILAGEVEMEEACYVGTGAIIHPKIKLGKNVTVAAGAVVTKNIPDDAVVSGVPAEIKFRKKNAY